MRWDLWRETDPWREVDRGSEFTGDSTLDKFERLAGSLAGSGGHVEYRLNFGRDDLRKPIVDVWVKAELPLLCQRSLNKYTQIIERNARLGLIESDSLADRLPDDQEPLLVTDEEFRLGDIIEDELILAVPLVPIDQNSQQPSYENPVLDMEDEEEEKENPFAVLNKLK